VLRFSAGQIQTMNDQADDEMAELLAEIIRDVLADDLTHLSDAELLAISRSRLREAKQAGLSRPEDIALYIQACLLLAPEFPMHMPGLARIVTNDNIAFEERARAVARAEAGLDPQ
jgi:hypothetical protein